MQKLITIEVQAIISYIYSSDFAEESNNLLTLRLSINKDYSIDSIRGKVVDLDAFVISVVTKNATENTTTVQLLATRKALKGNIGEDII